MRSTENLLASPELSSALEAIAAPAILLDQYYRICAANSVYRETFSFEQKLEGQTCFQVSHGYDSPCDQCGESCPMKACQQSGQAEKILHIHNTPTGREHVDVELFPITDHQHQITYYIEIMRPLRTTESSDQQGMIGESPVFRQMLHWIHRSAPSNINVLLLGESGTGKEVAAQAIHDFSNRQNNPFVTVECTGLTESLFESELFGHEKGAFTGATQRKSGLIAAADGGTLFLDEVGDIPLSLQVKLLRLIETGSYRPVGAVTPVRADFRLVCATNCNLLKMVESGTFREDLYYRISPFPIHLPPLRRRQSDIPLLAKHLLQRLRPDENFRLSRNASDWLSQQKFPGNIRELRNILERATLLTDSRLIEPEHLQTGPAAADKETQDSNHLTAFPLLPLEQLEQRYLQQISRSFSGDNAALAQALGISERTLYRKLRQIRTPQ